jgi:ATPase components of ABC transporters with duplicated ATPase domains
MSVVASGLSFCYPNQNPLFENLNLAVERQDKVAILGNNGAGKSTLLKLIAGLLRPTDGTISTASVPYYIPQHTGRLNISVAEALGIRNKLDALIAITGGSLLQSDYDTLGNDWDIESRCCEAFAFWSLGDVDLDASVDELSGGEKTKLLLSGLMIHRPEIILLDEPTNHLDGSGREILYEYIEESKAVIIIVSHDITLLNKLNVIYEFSELGIRRYGGNYDFYREHKDIEEGVLSDKIRSEEKALRLARKKAQEVRERQEKRLSKGAKNKGEVPRIFKKTLTNSSENTASRLQGQHAEIIDEKQSRLSELRQQQSSLKEMKMNFDNSSIHPNKLLIEAVGINYSYSNTQLPALCLPPELVPPSITYGENLNGENSSPANSVADKGSTLWQENLDIKIFSRDRIRITGDNGSGKTTLIKLLTGALQPLRGEIKRGNFNWIYLDQEYSQVDMDTSVVELAVQYNLQSLAEHEIKIRLNRFLFPPGTWSKNCRDLSGGEKMRLYLCCLNISSKTPDMIILDEPTNNLDISGLQILIQAMKEYSGCLLVISHDNYFVEEVGASMQINVSH